MSDEVLDEAMQERRRQFREEMARIAAAERLEREARAGDAARGAAPPCSEEAVPMREGDGQRIAAAGAGRLERPASAAETPPVGTRPVRVTRSRGGAGLASLALFALCLVLAVSIVRHAVTTAGRAEGVTTRHGFGGGYDYRYRYRYGIAPEIWYRARVVRLLSGVSGVRRVTFRGGSPVVDVFAGSAPDHAGAVAEASRVRDRLNAARPLHCSVLSVRVHAGADEVDVRPTGGGAGVWRVAAPPSLPPASGPVTHFTRTG